MPATQRRPDRQEDGARNGGPHFNTGGWLGTAADVFSVQRKYK
jgi:hypothetical protein